MTIQDIFLLFGRKYIMKYGKKIPLLHIKVIFAILWCRMGEYGITFYKCEGCGKVHSVFRSCGNRHCPSCQKHKTKLWIKRNLERKLPGDYFMITFTVPKELRRFIRSNQKICYSSLFDSSSRTLKKMISSGKHIKGNIGGFMGVLHTWTRQLEYHPHVHYVVPAGAFDANMNWHKTSNKFFLPVHALSKIYKAKFKDLMEKHGLLDKIDPSVWDKKWVVNSQHAGNGDNCLKYLSRYIFKVAISDSRIVKVGNGRVYFKYKDKKLKKFETMDIPVFEFIRRYLQHVLPSGFMKVRYYGFYHHSFKIDFEKLQEMVAKALKIKLNKVKREVEVGFQAVCSECQCKLEYMFSIIPKRMRGQPAT